MLFLCQIAEIRRNADLILMALGPYERLRLDSIDLRRYDLRTAAQDLRNAADRVEALADRFDDPVEIEHMEAAE